MNNPEIFNIISILQYFFNMFSCKPDCLNDNISSLQALCILTFSHGKPVLPYKVDSTWSTMRQIENEIGELLILWSN